MTEKRHTASTNTLDQKDEINVDRVKKKKKEKEIFKYKTKPVTCKPFP